MMPTQSDASLPVFLGRLFWMMVGPLILVLLAFTIVIKGSGWLTLPDLAFLGVLGSLLLARWLEFRGGNPQTSTGEPATSAHLRRYAISTIVLGVSAWVAANFVGNHLLNL
jgi:hypothetical protein